MIACVGLRVRSISGCAISMVAARRGGSILCRGVMTRTRYHRDLQRFIGSFLAASMTRTEYLDSLESIRVYWENDE